MSWNRIGDIFSILVILMYLAAGGYIMFHPGLRYIPQTIRVIFGIFLVLYGLYRLARVIYKDTDRED
jgi:hypothetical protein